MNTINEALYEVEYETSSKIQKVFILYGFFIWEIFDFSNPEFFNKIGELSESYSKNTELRKFNANRGSKHFIYINRTFFGLYSLMFDLKASNVKINQFKN